MAEFINHWKSNRFHQMKTEVSTGLLTVQRYSINIPIISVDWWKILDSWLLFDTHYACMGLHRYWLDDSSTWFVFHLRSKHADNCQMSFEFVRVWWLFQSFQHTIKKWERETPRKKDEWQYSNVIERAILRSIVNKTARFYQQRIH